jgi:hypothetical protein
MSSHIKAGVAHKKLKTYLAYLTRLRQAVGYLFLLEGALKVNFTLEDFNYLRSKLSKIGGKTPMHRQLAYWLQLEYEADMGGNGDNEFFGKSRFGYQFDMDQQLAEMEAGTSMEDVTCRLCYDTSVDPKISDVSAIPRSAPWSAPASLLTTVITVRTHLLLGVHYRRAQTRESLPDLQRRAISSRHPQATRGRTWRG